MSSSLAQTASKPSRAAQVAEIHLASINISRKRCGLAPLDAATLALEYADLDRQPANTKVGHRAAGNVDKAAPARSASGVILSQREIDAIYAESVDRLNATLPAQWRPKRSRVG